MSKLLSLNVLINWKHQLPPRIVRLTPIRRFCYMHYGNNHYLWRKKFWIHYWLGIRNSEEKKSGNQFRVWFVHCRLQIFKRRSTNCRGNALMINLVFSSPFYIRSSFQLIILVYVIALLNWSNSNIIY